MDFYDRFRTMPEDTQRRVLDKMRCILTYRGWMPSGILAMATVAKLADEAADLLAKAGLEVEELT